MPVTLAYYTIIYCHLLTKAQEERIQKFAKTRYQTCNLWVTSENESENASYQYILLFPQSFQKALS